MLFGVDNCDEGGLSCTGIREEPGNQLAGIDVSWRPRWSIPTNIYFQTVGEDEAGYFPSRKSWMYGISSQIILFDNPVQFNIEYIDTSVEPFEFEGINFDGNNILYEHGIYRTGYRYLGRSIGSTLDNDSRSLNLSARVQTSEWGDYSVHFADIAVNNDSAGNHSILSLGLDEQTSELNEFRLKWRYRTQSVGDIQVNLLSRSRELITSFQAYDKTAVGVSWTVAL
jgi:hypothetical protein